MYREITTVNASVYQIPIPKELRGKKIEIIAFAVDGNNQVLDTDNTALTKTSFAERTKHLTFDSGDYKFDRNEANDYE
jgi:hypothetical protein